MAAKTYIGDSGGIAREIKKLYVGDANGVAREVTALYAGDSNGVARRVFEVGPAGRLPAGYTEVEYIQNGTSATQGYIPYIKMPGQTSAVKFEIKFSLEQTAAYSSLITTVYGYKNSGTAQYGICVYNNQKIRYYRGSATAFSNLANYSAGAIYNIAFDSTAKTAVVNGTALSVTTSTYWRTAVNYLFGRYNSSYSENSAVRAKVYSLKMRDADGNLLLDFVPCIDPSGVVGMYDTVGGVFYKSSNTSTNSNNKFIAGPAV